MYYVADTHAFLWYLAGSNQLSKKARQCFAAADQGEATIILPAIVLLECIDVIDKKKINFPFESIIAKLNEASNFILAEVNWSLILEVNQLKHFKDLHDRVIVATAKLFDAQLISRDQYIRVRYPKVVW